MKKKRTRKTLMLICWHIFVIIVRICFKHVFSPRCCCINGNIISTTKGIFRKIMLMSKYDNFVLETDFREYLYLFYSIFNKCFYYEKNIFLGYLID